MNPMKRRFLLLPAICALAVDGAAAAGIDYNRDVRPILSNQCFKCHGFDPGTRKAKLRLDLREEALKPSGSDEVPIVPGKPEASELMRRIESRDQDEVMPPGKDHEPLKPGEIAILKQWITEGAEYQAHWAFVPPRPGNENSIDAIVQKALAKRHLKPSPRADEATLIRRVSLALTGLPNGSGRPDESSRTYEQLVDDLLASQHFGERLALDWLDVARYADTNGYYTDAERQAWPWRDWVIRAFNANMPFDRFTLEQMAGDLLPNATLDQRIATAFNRNHMVTNETGVIEEEYRLGYVSDRVETTAAAWLGITLGCAKCHDHKYDPLTQRDYFSLFAAFNNIDEKGIIKELANPVIQLPTKVQEQQLAGLTMDLKQRQEELAARRPSLNKEIGAWEKSALQSLPAAPKKGSLVHFDFDADNADHGPKQVKSATTGKLVSGPGVKGHATVMDATQYIDFADPQPMERDQAFSLSVWINPGSSPQGCVASKQDSNAEARGFEILWYKAQPRINLAHRYGNDGIEVVAKDKFSGGQWRHLVITYDGSSKAAGLRVYVDGKLSEVDVRRDSLSGSIASKEPWRIGWKGTGIGFEGSVDEFRLYDRAINADEVTALHWREFLEGTLTTAQGQRIRSTSDKLEAYYIEHHGTPELVKLSQQVMDARSNEAEARKKILSIAVMQEMPKPRETHILTRGQYDQPGEKVTFAVPAALGRLPASAPQNRLGLTQWLVSRDNPLTARVVVNRLWAQCFGDGLVRTPNDFGLQGEAPDQPELLDFLALRFRDGDAQTKPWDVKALLKLIVMSATFQQSSNFTPALLAQDPENRLLARGPRFRLPAEIIRDQALAVSGLLVPKIGGPSVKPYQPPGLWEAVSYNGEASYQSDSGEATHRRGLYTFWKRQSPPPDMLTLDGPTREVCTIRRPRTNTPLQALLLLNDSNYQETARALAKRALSEKSDRLAKAFQMATGRAPKPAELAELQAFLDQQLTRSPELAAWTMLASLLLNLDEVQNQH
jgi:hypothetical protein